LHKNGLLSQIGPSLDIFLEAFYLVQFCEPGVRHGSHEIKDSLSTTMQHAPKRRFRGPRNPKVLRRHLKAVEICLHSSHPSVEWIEIFVWSYEIYQGTIGAVLILKMFYSSGQKSDIRTLDVSHSSQQTSEKTRKVFIYTSSQNNVTMDDPVSS